MRLSCLTNKQMTCDNCGATIAEGQDVFIVNVWIDGECVSVTGCSVKCCREYVEKKQREEAA